ncbi:hypothetical protein SEA_MOLLYMUR_56 [Gordonia phage Mollymur]|uniref:Uncharacterized protein n=1 Tax=Gordonia phage Mollymur TaxID=2590895 RepID=A0A4Y6EAG9_9CAUD|nr:hypothetical protein PQB84_gp069 [Gordonia phage Mollymur]QDF15417.1 hypothetical protein SEA_MOLLYMUR_56 [Gordonia phage Mollymur]
MTGMWPYTRVEGLWQFVPSTWERRAAHAEQRQAEYHYETPHMIWDNPIFPPRGRPAEVPYVPGALHTASGRAMVGLDKPWWLEQIESAQALFPNRSAFERVLQVAKRGWISGRRSDAC